MVYQYDLALPMPTKDLYDTLIMQMAVAAAKDMYDKGEKRIQDFYDKYGDFYSPVPGATEDVYNTGVGKIKSEINDLYAQGIDPVRSVEGRARIAQIIRGVDVARINARKQEAELAKQYIKNRDIAIMNGTFDEAVERAMHGGKLLEEWTPADGYWNTTAPVKYMSQDDIISPLAKALNPEFDAVRTAQENNGYDYKTVSEDRIRQMVNDNIDDLIGKSTMGKYYYDLALKASGNDPNTAKQLLIELYVQAAKKHTKEDRELNQHKYQDMLAKERRRAARELAALNYHYDQLKQWDFDGNGKIDTDEFDAKKRYKEAQILHYKNIKNTDPNKDKYPNVFRAADKEPGTYILYDKKYLYENKIDPATPKIVSDKYSAVDKNGKIIESPEYFRIKAGDVADVINNGYIISANGNKLHAGEHQGDIQFVADGYIVKKYYNYKDKNGKKKSVPRYYMSGELKGALQGGGFGDANIINSKTNRVLVLINERDANYGKLQEKDKSDAAN